MQGDLLVMVKRPKGAWKILLEHSLEMYVLGMSLQTCSSMLAHFISLREKIVHYWEKLGSLFGWYVIIICSSFAAPISFPELRSPWPAVRKRELWEHPFQACAIDTIDTDCALRSETGCAKFGYFHCYLKMDAPRALVFRPLVKGNEALGTRLLRLLLHRILTLQ